MDACSHPVPGDRDRRKHRRLHARQRALAATASVRRPRPAGHGGAAGAHTVRPAPLRPARVSAAGRPVWTDHRAARTHLLPPEPGCRRWGTHGPGGVGEWQLFRDLRVTPHVGRFFDESADREGTTPLAVLSHRLWQRRFDADPAVVGQPVRVNGRPVIVAGVAPPAFVGAMQLVAADLWLPAAMYPDLAPSAEASTIPMFGVMGRVAGRVKVEEAGARLTSMVAALADPGSGQAPPAVVVTPAAGFGVPVALQGAVLTLSGLIYVMMALLMAVACANVAALVLARGAGRSREMAVRLSLGASRMHIARHLLTESVVLALAGCAVGTVVALWLTQVLVARLTTPFQYVSYAIDVHPDARVFAYSAIATAAAAVLCGIAPIRFAGRVDVVDVLKQSAAKGRSRGSMRTLNAMVVMQFAVSTTLLVAAGMLVRSYMNAQSVHPRFDTAGLVASTLDVDHVGLDRAAGIRLYQTVIERLSALPGVTDVSLTRDVPLRPSQTVTVLADTDSRTRPFGEQVPAAAMVVSPRYFHTIGLPIRQGRSFVHGEPPRPLVAVINEAMARRLWPGVSPLGRAFRLNHTDAEPIEVIGVVSNTEEGPLNQRPQLTFYRPFPHEYVARMTVLLRVQHDPSRVFAEVRRTIRGVNQDLSIVDLRTIDELRDDLAGQRRIPATALAVVALLGLLLSAVGLYGVVAYGVRERARELGIRLALGARPSDVRRLVLRQGFTMVGIGLAVGGLATVGFTQVVRSALFGVGPLDPATLGVVCAVLMATGFAALYLPARWASRLEPARTLRSE
ncbi:MAG: FtsX-like permease family protein [Luteitalea sp.]|nr:FtsX-like permease family protein [Luteitalea sp.]